MHICALPVICAFSELSEEQKRNIYQFVSSFEYSGGFDSFEEMSGFYGGIAFGNGSSHFSLWEEGGPVGTLGVIAKNAAGRALRWKGSTLCGLRNRGAVI
ncbi:MAG TPA: hypothetical protein VN580_05085 [Clostridia bacterium]|nr:hypothetical protein [Clostridia bacterium]